jgi:hypothetical protein
MLDQQGPPQPADGAHHRAPNRQCVSWRVSRYKNSNDTRCPDLGTIKHSFGLHFHTRPKNHMSKKQPVPPSKISTKITDIQYISKITHETTENQYVTQVCL